MACPPAVAPVAAAASQIRFDQLSPVVLADVHKIGDTGFGMQTTGMHTVHHLIEDMRKADFECTFAVLVELLTVVVQDTRLHGTGAPDPGHTRGRWHLHVLQYIHRC